MAKTRERLPDDLVYSCPEELPEGFDRWVRNHVIRNDRTLIYFKGNVRGVCHHCGRKVRAYRDKFYQGHRIACPECGEMVLCILSGGASWRADYVANVAALQRSREGTIFARIWHLCRSGSAEYPAAIGAHLQEIARYAIRGDLVAGWKCEYKDGWYSPYPHERSYGDWERLRDVTEVYDGPYEFFPDFSPLQGTRLRYGEPEKYLAKSSSPNIVRYLLDLARYPVMEYLIKAGYMGLIDSRVCGCSAEDRHAILWTRRTLKECFRIPLRLLKAWGEPDWTLRDLNRANGWWRICSMGHVREQDIPAMLELGLNASLFTRIVHHASPVRALKYLKGQTPKRPTHYSLSDYSDYIDECERLGLDLHDKQVLFPPDLIAAHARTSAQVKHQMDEAKRRELSERAERLAAKAWAHAGLLIRPATTLEELIEEGAALRHCVAGYAERMAAGKTAIFFIRRADAPDTPYYTLELRDGAVQQCRTRNNASYEREPEVAKFVAAWLKKIKKERAA